MANAAWPGSLPAYVLEQGYNERLPNNVLRTQMEAGPPKQRRRFTKNWRPFAVSIKMTEEQADIFEAFYGDTLADGTLPFDWLHPRRRTAITFRFSGEPPVITKQGEAVIVSCQLESLG